jgi:rare lipoprotein A
VLVRASRTQPRTPLVLRGRATWYGPGFAGRTTASGETYDPDHALTAAHRWLPFGTLLRVCRGPRCVVVRVNDRGPYGAAILDLSHLAAERLGMVRAGIVPVTATVLVSSRA